MDLVDAINLLVAMNTGARPGWKNAVLVEVSPGVYGIKAAFYDSPGVAVYTVGELNQLEYGYGMGRQSAS